MQNEAIGKFSVEKLYIKDLSVEAPNAPEIFLSQDQPEINVQLHSSARQVDPNWFEVILTVSVKAMVKESLAFLVEVGQAGAFRIENVSQDQMEGVLAITCPTVLFPFAREVISNAIVRAGFPPLLLQPVNFEAMYMERLELEKKQKTEKKSESTVENAANDDSLPRA